MSDILDLLEGNDNIESKEESQTNIVFEEEINKDIYEEKEEVNLEKKIQKQILKCLGVI